MSWIILKAIHTYIYIYVYVYVYICFLNVVGLNGGVGIFL